jgi:hypothetical protein
MPDDFDVAFGEIRSGRERSALRAHRRLAAGPAQFTTAGSATELTVTLVDWVEYDNAWLIANG